jgi:peptide/nickel transport system permease protein
VVGMLAYVVRRVLLTIPMLLGITFVTFVIINAQGNPVADLQRNPRFRPADIERIRENLGLNEPLTVRYVKWLSNLARGDLGISLSNATPVRDRIFDVLPNTILLTGVALLVSLLLSIPLGIYSAIKRGSWFDNTVTVLSVAAFAMPTFWLALLLILVFASQFRTWGLPSLPVSGMVNVRGGGDLLDRVRHLILPVVALSIGDLAGWTRYIRSQMLEVIRQDFVRTAQAKGLHGNAIIFGHAFRNALLPLVTLIGLSLPGLVGGAFIVETVFAWPGLGRLTVEAARKSDYTLILGTVLMFSVLTLLANLLADLAYAALDPRIRYG